MENPMLYPKTRENCNKLWDFGIPNFQRKPVPFRETQLKNHRRTNHFVNRNHQRLWNVGTRPMGLPDKKCDAAIWTVGYTYVPLNPIPIFVDFIWYVLIKEPNVQSIGRTFELIGHFKLIHLLPVFFILLICAISWRGHSREGSTSSSPCWCLRINQPPIDWGGYHFRR